MCFISLSSHPTLNAGLCSPQIPAWRSLSSGITHPGVFTMTSLQRLRRMSMWLVKDRLMDWMDGWMDICLLNVGVIFRLENVDTKGMCVCVSVTLLCVWWCVLSWVFSVSWAMEIKHLPSSTVTLCAAESCNLSCEKRTLASTDARGYHMAFGFGFCPSVRSLRSSVWRKLQYESTEKTCLRRLLSFLRRQVGKVICYQESVYVFESINKFVII